MYSYDWTPERLATLRKLVDRGLLLSQVAHELDTSFGVVRRRMKIMRLRLKGVRGRQRREDSAMDYVDTRGEQATRTCLSCGKDFPSEHKGNRRCDHCLNRQEPGYAEAHFGSRPLDGYRVAPLPRAA